MRLIGFLLASPAEAEDVAQEAFARAYVAVQAGTKIEDFAAWMRRVATNAAFNQRRSVRRRREARERLARQPVTPPRGLPMVQKDLVGYVMGQLGYADQAVVTAQPETTALASTLRDVLGGDRGVADTCIGPRVRQALPCIPIVAACRFARIAGTGVLVRGEDWSCAS